ncbi:hypothetical protein [Frigoribacterium sp. VKM Ac-2836]|uniref:hypothetical protein n=1 Tax=Frigoribacterium sp. VKM Ac-2836 TaxID=2739014 RepID=UPI001565FC41|nr:hypothetical protein [Frigoribacterium sp. VKM Ac-2836]NRD27699.1 hypothetical protein [Frigoribacterium sp. VKM Ac-2836]
MRRSALAVAFSMSLAVTGCAGGGESDRDDRLTVDGAKTETMAIERSVVDSFPAAEVVSVDQASTGVLLSCSDDTYQWTGRVTVQMDGASDRAAVLDVIAGAFDDQDGYDSTIDEQTGDPRLLVTGPGGAASVGRFDESSHLVTLASASRCFALREGENSYDTY